MNPRDCPAHATELGRAVTSATLLFGEKCLDGAILTRVVRNDGDDSPNAERVDRGGETFVKLTFFCVDGDSQRLEDARRHVAPTAGCFGDRALHGFAQFVGGLRLAFVDRLRNGAGEAPFTVIPEQSSEFVLIDAHDQLGGGFTGRRVHAHVKRCVCTKRETTIRLIQLVRGHTEVHQDAHHIVAAHKVGSAIEYIGELGEGRLHYGNPIAIRCETLTGLVQGRRVSVNAQNS